MIEIIYDKIRHLVASRRTVISQRGDTIVEVMFALAVLGAVLSGAYVVVSRSVQTNQSSQERLEAVKLAESQFEKLKILSVNDSTVFTKSSICLNAANQAVPDTDTVCRVDRLGVPTTVDPSYKVSITRAAYVTAGTRFKVSVAWASIRGSGNDSLEYYYELYR